MYSIIAKTDFSKEFHACMSNEYVFDDGKNVPSSAVIYVRHPEYDYDGYYVRDGSHYIHVRSEMPSPDKYREGDCIRNSFFGRDGLMYGVFINDGRQWKQLGAFVPAYCWQGYDDEESDA